MLAPTEDPRASLKDARRIVAKIGSRALVGDGTGVPGRFESLAAQVAALRAAGHEVVLVSSGAVALGFRRLGLPARPTQLPQLQASAAVGQSRLIETYEKAFEPHGLCPAQVLLTHDGISDRERYINARHAIDALLELGTVPIINENDTVSTEEIEFGDNDQLAAMVASLVGADLLLLLTDVPGVLDENRQRIALVRDASALGGLIWEEKRTVSLGGMASKVGAAQRALLRGVPVVIGPAAELDVLPRVVAGEDIGTLFLPEGAPMASRKHWIAHTLRATGRLTLDAGAVRAVIDDGCSLLPIGVRATSGDYQAGEAVAICAPDGAEIGRGLVRYAAREVEQLIGLRSDAIAETLGHHDGDELIHRDDLVVHLDPGAATAPHG